MNKSNQAPLQLDVAQSTRLMQLFHFSAANNLPSPTQERASEPTIWHPVLTDIHDQVVHTISPVLVRKQAASQGLPPTLSLILLAPPIDQSTPRIGAFNNPDITDQLLPAPKQTL